MDYSENYHPANRLDDLLIEILSRLPVKSLLQYKCVSKSWHGLISDGQRQKKLPRAMSGLFYHVHSWGPDSSSVVEYVDMQTRSHGNSVGTDLTYLPRSSCTILDCSNGLLLCRSFENNSTIYYVSNPATKRWAELPQPGYRFRPLALVFDQHTSNHYSVLGFKVKKRYNDEIPILFSSKTGTWVERRVPWRCGFAPYISRHVFLNGNIHLLAYGEPVAVAIDFERETFRKIQLPGSKRGADYLNGCFGQSQRCLHYAQRCDNQLMVWVLNDYEGNEWSLKHSIDIKDLFGKEELRAAPLTSSVLLQMLIFHPELDVLFVKVHILLYAYHLISGKLTEIAVLSADTRLFHAYTPCLLDNVDWEKSL